MAIDIASKSLAECRQTSEGIEANFGFAELNPIGSQPNVAIVSNVETKVEVIDSTEDNESHANDSNVESESTVEVLRHS